MRQIHRLFLMLASTALLFAGAAPAYSQPQTGPYLQVPGQFHYYLPYNANATIGYDWLQFNGNSQHSGNNTWEINLKAGNVNQLVRLFQVTLPSIADGAPVYL